MNKKTIKLIDGLIIVIVVCAIVGVIYLYNERQSIQTTSKCTDECSFTGEKCIGDDVYVCKDLDGDGCKEQGMSTNCAPTQTCLNAKCVSKSIWPGVDLHMNKDYENYYAENPRVLDSLKDNSLVDKDTMLYIHQYIDELESLGYIKSIEKPAIEYIVEEGDNYYWEGYKQDWLVGGEVNMSVANRMGAAKIAHAIWLDKNKLVPWSLSDYTDEELDIVLGKDFTIVIKEWEEDGIRHREVEVIENFVSNFQMIIDHNPSDVYQYSQKFISNTQKETIYNILTHLRKDFAHGSREEGDITPLRPQAIIEVLTNYDEEGHRVSPEGCHSMSQIIVSMLRSLNIPSYVDDGWYAAVESGRHASAFFPTIQKILIHGDDIYYYMTPEASLDELLMSYNYFNSEVKSCGRDTKCARKATYKHHYLLHLKYPTTIFRGCYNFYPEACKSCIEEEAEKLTQKLKDEGLYDMVDEVNDIKYEMRVKCETSG